MPVRPLIAAAFAFFLPAVHAGKAHVHGEGKLDVAIDKETITISLELPLDAAVGFERAPKSDREKAALAEVERVLKDAAALFVPTPAANCTATEVKVGMPKFDGDHADIDADYAFRCANPAALKGIETAIFKSFKRLYRLETRRAGPAGQGAMRLTPNKPALIW